MTQSKIERNLLAKLGQEWLEHENTVQEKFFFDDKSKRQTLFD